ncbi:LuxR family transcriptional regulator [Coriobacteriales bacterium OH1046]|nr:LuxR family transcriptional regulator [Coriobacteriales bacterium OH1046]
MSLMWFIYTFAIIVIAIMACSTSMSLWVFTARKDCIAAAIAFGAYIFDTAIIFFDEYTQGKVDPNTYFDAGITHPLVTTVLATIIVASAWAWTLMRLRIKIDWPWFLMAASAFCLLEYFLCPVAGSAGRLRTLLYWGIRDLALIGTVAFGFWYCRHRVEDIEKLGFHRARLFYRAVFVLLCLILVEDICNIMLFIPDMDDPFWYEFWWHLQQRNITENITMAVLAVRKMVYDRDTMRVYARHPAEKGAHLKDEHGMHNFEERLLSYCDAKGLSPRERDVLELALKGKDTQGIATELYISTGTVKAHMHRIYIKAGVNGRRDLATAFWRF